jgi:preprotein translocase subunit SecG
MVTFLTVLHIIITVSLIFLVLIQDSKGGGMGAFGGGGNANSVLGATGATTLAAKLTQWFAVAFAISCIALAMTTSRGKKSVVDDMAPVPPPATMAAGVAATATPSPSATPAPEAPAAGKTSEQNSTPQK